MTVQLYITLIAETEV